MNRLLIFPLLVYLQFLYLIGAYKTKRSWVDDHILWCYKKLKSYGHKVEYNYFDK
jgi:hypothetical protein